MGIQDDINNLTNEIAEEEQSATILDKQADDERATSTQKIDTWQQQAGRHRDAANRMRQELDAKQKELVNEQARKAEEEKQ